MLAFYNIWRCFKIAKGKDEVLINEQIKCEEMMVIGPNGEKLGIKKREDRYNEKLYPTFDL